MCANICWGLEPTLDVGFAGRLATLACCQLLPVSSIDPHLRRCSVLPRPRRHALAHTPYESTEQIVTDSKPLFPAPLDADTTQRTDRDTSVPPYSIFRTQPQSFLVSIASPRSSQLVKAQVFSCLSWLVVLLRICFRDHVFII